MNDSANQNGPDVDPDELKKQVLEELKEQLLEELHLKTEDIFSEFQKALDQFQETTDKAVGEVTVLKNKAVTEIIDMAGVTRDFTRGGIHKRSADEDHKKANRLRNTSFGCAGFAVCWAIGIAVCIGVSPPEGWQWLARPFLVGPVAIMLWAAAYAQRESREHRTSARLFEHQAMALFSLEDYMNRITDEDAKKDFLNKIAPALFTNQIDAHTEQIKTQGRSGRSVLRLLQNKSRRNSEDDE